MTIAMTPSLFKQWVVASMVVPVVGIAVEIVRSPAPPDPEPFTMYQGIMLGFALLYFVAAVISTIGLCVFARWSRPLTLGLMVVGLMWTAFDGPTTSETDLFAFAIYQLSNMVNGAILAAAYWSPVREFFEPGSLEEQLENVFR